MSPQRRPLLILPLVLLALLGPGGCSTIHLEEAPTVSLVNIELGEVTVFETSGTVIVRVTNPNPEPITVNGASFNVAIEGRSLGKALTGETVEIPPMGSATLRTDVHLSNLAMATRIKSILESRKFGYDIDGTLHLAAGGRSGRLHTSNTGKVDAQDFAPTPRQ